MRDFDWYYLWRLHHNESVTLHEHTAYVTSVAFSPDGRVLVSGSQDNTIKLFFAATDEQVAAQRSN